MEGSGLVRDDGAVKNADLSWEEIQELGEAKAKTKRASTVAAYESCLRKIKVAHPEVTAGWAALSGKEFLLLQKALQTAAGAMPKHHPV
eukprot:gene12555-15778_t